MTFPHLFRPSHHLFTTFSVAGIAMNRLNERDLRRNLFRIGGAEEYGKIVQS